MAFIDQNDIKNYSVEPRHEGLSVENAFAGSLAIGCPVYISGINTTSTSPFYGMHKVTKADADASAPANRTMYLVVGSAIAQSGGGRVARGGVLINQDTSSWSAAGDPVYLDTTAGTLTPTAPSGADDNVQRIGYVKVKSSTVGEIVFNLRDYDVDYLGNAFASLLTKNNVWTGTNEFGVSGTGVDVTFYGDTATRDLVWDMSADCLRAADNTKIGLGSGAGTTPDISFDWDGTRLNITQLTTNSEMRYGVDGAGIDQRWYGDTASAALVWDQSADKLVLEGVAKIQLQTIAAATGTAIPVTHSGSFPITQNGAETNTLADPTYLGQTLSIFVDTDTSGARVITAASRINQAANTVITLTEVGDFIKLEAITIAGALKWQVVANDGAVLS